MTIQRYRRWGSLHQLRFIPVLTWAFSGLAIFNIINLIDKVVGGQQPFTTGLVVAIALIVGFTLVLNLLAGELAVATFDRERRTITLRRYGLRGRYSAERSLSDLESLNVKVLRGPYCQLTLGFRSGERLPLTTSYVLMLRLKAVTELTKALGVRLEAERVQR
jgi:hypothetical protein